MCARQKMAAVRLSMTAKLDQLAMIGGQRSTDALLADASPWGSQELAPPSAHFHHLVCGRVIMRGLHQIDEIRVQKHTRELPVTSFIPAPSTLACSL
jgi:hypothetical protein